MSTPEPRVAGYDYGTLEDVSAFTRMLWYCAGADAQLLVRCPNSDRVKYQGLGGIVLATGILAFLSGSYAFYTVFSPKDATALGASNGVDPLSVAVALVSGCVWALIIFNIERFIVSSTGKGDGTDAITWRELFQASPRILMAVIISLALSKPLEIRILEPEINAQLELEQQKFKADLDKSHTAEFDAKKAEIKGKIEAAQARLDERTAYFEKRRLEIVDQRKQLELEAEGLTGSGVAGRGPAWQDKKNTLDKLEEELTADREADKAKSQLVSTDIDTWKKDIATLEASHEDIKKSNAAAAHSFDGLMKRIQISHDIGPGISLAITLLLMCIELGPIFFKMMVNKGAYDYLEEQEKLLVRARAGVEPDAHVFTDAAGKQILRDRFHGPESLLDEYRRAAETERVLAESAHEAFRRTVGADVAREPGKYIAASTDDGATRG
jgi:hypothetical protein